MASYQIIREELNELVQEEVKVINDLTEKFVRYLPSLLKKNNVATTDNLSYLAVGDPSKLIDFVVHVNSHLEREFKEAILEEPRLEKRLKLLFELEKKTRKFQQNINAKVNEKLVEQQNAAYLRGQLEEIQRQLDKLEGNESEQDNYLSRLIQEPFPEHVKKVVRSELKNLQRMHAAEASIARTHIDWLMSIPWYQTTDEVRDLEVAMQQLNKNHFGLEKVKERIFEHLAVIHRTGKSTGNIICFVGPPGVGKTSLAASIAGATGRKFVKISVGGISDEGEIRGHRRTYVGAMPGKIIHGMKKAQVLNPLFLIDEIDKMVRGGYHGDPSNALLEVLDSSQNSNFVDNYLGEVNYDLSKVLFICTANSVNFPQPLLDRMEIINLSSYTELEKLQIAKNYLVSRNLNSSGLASSELKFTDNAIIEIIRSFTQEAGVRELDRIIAKITRKLIVEILRKERLKVVVTPKNINHYLGKPIYNFTLPKDDQVGTVNGLAYTYGGGDILKIEVNYFRGKDELNLTGTLGSIMKESATTALDYVKANCHLFSIKSEFFAENSIHIHVPEGAVPKDGPSAGITIATAIISALTEEKITSEVAMTGEITLRGHVLPIGGLKEKAIAAHRSKLKTIIIPHDNKKDLEDIPREVRESIGIFFVKEYIQVWNFLRSYGKLGSKETDKTENLVTS